MRQPSFIFFGYLIFLALLVGQVEMEISVPGFPQMQKYFNTSEELIQMTLGLNFATLCISAMFYGPLSDAFGRRPVLLFGTFILLIGSTGCTLAPTIQQLLAWRSIQGLGASVGLICFALVADSYRGERASNLIAALNGLLCVGAAGAPILGGLIVQAYGWRATYTFVAGLTAFALIQLYFFLPETNLKLQPLRVGQVFRTSIRLLSDKTFLLVALISTLQATAIIAFTAASTFFYINVMHTSVTAYSAHLAAVIAVFSLSSILAALLSSKISIQHMLLAGLVLTVVGGLGELAFALSDIRVPLFYTGAMSIFAAGSGLCIGPAFAASLELFPEVRGLVSSLVITIRFLVNAIGIRIVAVLADGTFIPESAWIFACSVMGAICLVLSMRSPRVRPLLLRKSETIG